MNIGQYSVILSKFYEEFVIFLHEITSLQFLFHPFINFYIIPTIHSIQYHCLNSDMNSLFMFFLM